MLNDNGYGDKKFASNCDASGLAFSKPRDAISAALQSTVLDACAMTPQEKERRILACLKGTPSESEAPRDILVNGPDHVVYVPKQPRSPESRDPAKTGDT